MIFSYFCFKRTIICGTGLYFMVFIISTSSRCTLGIFYTTNLKTRFFLDLLLTAGWKTFLPGTAGTRGTWFFDTLGIPRST